MVIEGVEYDTAYFDKGPMFVHYRTRTALLTSIEFDHADIYTSMAHYESAYERFCATLPADSERSPMPAPTSPSSSALSRDLAFAGSSPALTTPWPGDPASS